MKPLRLYIENFLCHDITYVDFELFDSALIMALINDNDELSNGAGKTSIFKAIEYVLFNKVDIVLDAIIRDDTDYCRVVLDFEKDGELYRVSRKKTRKSGDFSLFRKVTDDTSDSYIHTLVDTDLYVATDAAKLKDKWKNLSATRDGDTTKELDKLIKTNYKSFRNTVHFVQDDIDSIAKATPEKRKQKFKETLELSIYSKLEQYAKKKFTELTKQYEKNDTLIEVIGNPDAEITKLNKLLTENANDMLSYDINVFVTQELELTKQEKDLSKELHELKGSVASLTASRNALVLEINKLEESLKKYKSKSKESSLAGKELVSKITSLKTRKEKLDSFDFSKIELLEKEVNVLQETVVSLSGTLQATMIKQKDLSLPLPEDDTCKHCRQALSPEHKERCKQDIKDELNKCAKTIKNTQEEINKVKKSILEKNAQINELNKVKTDLVSVNNSLESLKNDLENKKSIHNELKSFYEETNDSLSSKKDTLSKLDEKIDLSSVDKLRTLEGKIRAVKEDLSCVLASKNTCAKQIAHLQNTKAILEHNVKEKLNDKNKLKDLLVTKKRLADEMKYYPAVIQSFSSTGIPNLIIQTVLDDLQVEANELLDQLKPGLQLEFIVKKEKSDDDTLDILYYVNGKKRYFEQLSGAMKLSVMFSVKVGMSFLLQKMMGFNIPLLMLDEVDQSLDKASTDAFADIVKFFQKDFKILVITHDDRLKHKFSNVIVVRQNTNAVSRAKVENNKI